LYCIVVEIQYQGSVQRKLLNGLLWAFQEIQTAAKALPRGRAVSRPFPAPSLREIFQSLANLIPDLQFCLALHGFTVPEFRALPAALASFPAFFEKELCQRSPREECEGALVTQSSKSVVTDHAT
jgi:hypothetical protein